LDRQIAGGRNRAHRHHVAESPVQFRFRLLHRSHQVESRQGAAALHRKQTVANGERFITPELKEMEGKILGAEERSVKLEYELFQRVREEVLGQLPKIQQTAAALAQLDVLASFAETARLHNIAVRSRRRRRRAANPRRPASGAGTAARRERFVPNDTGLSGAAGVRRRPGSNEGGESRPGRPPRQAGTPVLRPKSRSSPGRTWRAKALTSGRWRCSRCWRTPARFVPAAEARIDLVDRIFTRIGASDDLARGQSTFMVEMTETANILNNATPRSLIVLDEIGRGTSTFDGLSLAWSIVEHLHNQVGAKTLFATHYHELTELAARLPRLKNFNVAVREWHDQIVFLRKIVEGGTDKSYGIQVARLAGVPKEVLERAKVILGNLEESELTPEGNVRQPRAPAGPRQAQATRPAAADGFVSTAEDLSARRARHRINISRKMASRRCCS
jgi:DNA mismatch repair protein MutS